MDFVNKFYNARHKSKMKVPIGHLRGIMLYAPSPWLIMCHVHVPFIVYHGRSIMIMAMIRGLVFCYA
jgi:hypothetical protein